MLPDARDAAHAAMNDDAATPSRLFFAVMPDDAARVRLEALAEATARSAGGRASAPDTLHLTVVFIGTVEASAIDAVRDAGDAMHWERFALSLDVVGSFSRAGIAWAAPSGMPPALARANRDLVAALSARGIDSERRPYRPHVTLARRCARAIDGAIDPPIAWSVDAVVLMSSRLLSDGARYRPIASWPSR
jgi:2'-5' RNA ligase